MRRDSSLEDWKALREKFMQMNGWYFKPVRERLLELLEALPEEKARTERKPDQKI